MSERSIVHIIIIRFSFNHFLYISSRETQIPLSHLPIPIPKCLTLRYIAFELKPIVRHSRV